MLSKNNFNEKLGQMNNQKDHFAIRKLTVGAASVLIGISFMGFGGQAVHADEMTTDSQANNQIDNTKESAQLVKPITEADVKATAESQKAEIADKTNEVKPSDTQVQEKQKEQTSEVKTPDTTSNKDEQKSNQTQSLVVDKKATENTQAATDIAAEKVQKTVQPQAKIQALIALPAESESQFNVDDWDGSLDNTTHEYTLNKYHGDKENIYIPNTQDFINAGRISSDDKVYITKDLMHSITINGAVNVTVDDQGEKNKVYAKGDWNRAFSSYRTNLKHVNLSHVDTSGVTNMNSLFLGSNDLQSVDLSGCDLSNVTDTSSMFAWADWNIKDVNLDNTKGVTREILDEYVNAAKYTNKTNLDLSGINLSPSITSFNNLFSNMPNIESIDLTGWDTGNITDMSYMFFNDPKLTTIKGLEDFNTSNVTNMAFMFAAFNNPTTDDYDPKGHENLGHLTKLNLSNWTTSNVTDMSYMFSGQTNLTSLGKLSNWSTSKVTNMASMFYDLENIDDSELDLTGWDTSNVTDMSYMFSKMFLQKDLSFVNNWKTGKVTDMSYMFAKDKNLEKLDLSKWDVSSVGLKNTEQNYSLAVMFAGDTSLTTVGDISHWNTKNVHDTRHMFYNTPKLTNIDLSGWNTSKLQIAEGMFDASGAKQINIDNWNLSNIKRITPAGYVEGKAGEGVLRGVENMFKNLTNPAVISMNNVILPDARNAFEINDFEGNKAIVVIANGKNGEALQDLLKINNQTWTDNDKSGNTITGRQNSDYVTYVRADNSKQIGQRGLNFIFTNLDDLHQYFNQVTNADNVKNDIGELSHDWDTQQDTDNNIVKITLRLSPASSYDPYRENIHAEKDGNILADLMTSKYQLHIVAPTKTTETKNPTRKIIIENPDGTISTKEQVVEFKREVTKHVDGTEEATSWTPTSGEWTKFDVPQIAGYDSYVDGTQSKTVASKPVNKDTGNVTVVITYKSNAVNPEPIIPDPVKPEVDPDKKDPQEPKTDPVTPTTDEIENLKLEKKAAKKNHSSIEHKKTGTHTIKLSNRVAPKGTQVTNGSKKSASTVNKAADSNKNTLPQTGEKKSNAGLIGLALIALASLGLIDRKRRD
ncbi:hypothetical protein FC52_GL000756 [Lactobacillus pasteurii DSM 23907 = CRBIP 24.76]|uniref:Putative membrane protein n=1 Tax=Lactobacillus pasteurii DSM 23907 = CRBIP 24.76 TaxID=1423790 RepID=I7JXB1_9LACO|nr:BspA family leucine-rich repeat surface protein [Lactobacillus pasteurii]KRK07312.1 hypothetical protein FC52_GL000756 [Lactobacillus pasteurii DSM 23907 = CRBIP 24.76]TDG76803.1 hypothetical protein C5L33_001423 [Lactobacillus pasteurii]CCI84450.1 Putative membrane protein [Lactobacillus pasteurii DSM 23907 = CRBIP 24.76]